MQPRMTNIVILVPEALKAMQALGDAVHDSPLPGKTIDLVHLRASQINGCSVCVDMHAKALKRSGETDERIYAVAAWRDAPYFNDTERAALALTEAVTRLSDRPDPVPDDLWAEAAAHFDEAGLAAVILDIAQINVWNRLNVSTRQVAGEWLKSPEARKYAEAGAAAR